MAAVVLAAGLGAVVGGLAGFVGRRLDEILMRVTDLMLAFPTVILALVITAALGAGIRNAVIAIMVAWWPTYARLIRGLVLAVREREYVQVAVALGASDGRVLLRYIAPNAKPPAVVSLFTRPGCGFCARAKAALDKRGWPYEEIVLGQNVTNKSLRAVTGQGTVPQVYVDGERIGRGQLVRSLDPRVAEDAARSRGGAVGAAEVVSVRALEATGDRH